MAYIVVTGPEVERGTIPPPPPRASATRRKSRHLDPLSPRRFRDLAACLDPYSMFRLPCYGASSRRARD
ncbi:hypothetical protein MRX96_044055 [Rhipicephalus microplus]